MTGRLTPVSWEDLVRTLLNLGFSGPYRTGKHHFVVKGEFRLTIPNPHGRDIGVPLLKEILNRAGISRDEWFGQTPRTQ